MKNIFWDCGASSNFPRRASSVPSMGVRSPKYTLERIVPFFLLLKFSKSLLEVAISICWRTRIASSVERKEQTMRRSEGSGEKELSGAISLIVLRMLASDGG